MKWIKYAFIGSRKAHTVRAEKALGHRLPQKAVVHHPDEDSLNPNARLVICQDNAHHLLLHVRARVLRAGGNPNTDAMCGGCQMPKPITDFAPSATRSTGRSHLCHACDALKAAKRRRTQAMKINAQRRARWIKRRDEANAARRADRAARPEWYRQESRRQFANDRENITARNQAWLAEHKDVINARRREKRLQLALDQVEIWEKGIDVLAAELEAPN